MAQVMLAGRDAPDALKGTAEDHEDRARALAKGRADWLGGVDRARAARGGLRFAAIGEFGDHHGAKAFAPVATLSGAGEAFKFMPLSPMAKMASRFHRANAATRPCRPAGVFEIAPRARRRACLAPAGGGGLPGNRAHDGDPRCKRA